MEDTILFAPQILKDGRWNKSLTLVVKFGKDAAHLNINTHATRHILEIFD